MVDDSNQEVADLDTSSYDEPVDQEQAYEEESSDAEFDISGDEDTVWKHDFQVTLARELTPTIFFDTDYEYKYDGDGNNSDKIESHLEWGYRSAGLAFGYVNDRVFESGLDISRTYTVEFFMDF